MDFQRKSRFFAVGHTAVAPNNIRYSCLLSRDSVHIGFLLSSPNGVEINAIGLDNAYLNTLYVEKIWCIGDDEYGENKGRVLLIFCALYSLKSPGLLWISDLASAFW